MAQTFSINDEGCLATKQGAYRSAMTYKVPVYGSGNNELLFPIFIKENDIKSFTNPIQAVEYYLSANIEDALLLSSPQEAEKLKRKVIKSLDESCLDETSLLNMALNAIILPKINEQYVKFLTKENERISKQDIDKTLNYPRCITTLN